MTDPIRKSRITVTAFVPGSAASVPDEPVVVEDEYSFVAMMEAQKAAGWKAYLWGGARIVAEHADGATSIHELVSNQVELTPPDPVKALELKIARITRRVEYARKHGLDNLEEVEAELAVALDAFNVVEE